MKSLSSTIFTTMPWRESCSLNKVHTQKMGITKTCKKKTESLSRHNSIINLCFRNTAVWKKIQKNVFYLKEVEEREKKRFVKLKYNKEIHGQFLTRKIFSHTCGSFTRQLSTQYNLSDMLLCQTWLLCCFCSPSFCFILCLIHKLIRLFRNGADCWNTQIYRKKCIYI